MTCINRIVAVLKSDTLATKTESVPIAILSAIGVDLRAHSDRATDIGFLLDWWPWYVWSALLVVLAVLRTVDVFIRPMPMGLRMATPVLGCGIWGCFVATALTTAAPGMAIVFFIPALQEMWILGRFFYDDGL